MPDTKITALTAIGANPIIPATFPIPMVDLTDTSMAASGTTKKVTVNQILGAGGTATLASATITGDLTVDTSTLKVDSANDNVIVGATSAIGGGRFSVQADLSAKQAICAKNSAASYSATNNFIRFTNSTDATVGGITHPAVTSLGVWGVSDIQFLLSGAGTTAMTLNSTGLGVGGSPNYKLNVTGPATSFAGSPSLALYDTTVGSPNSRNWLIGNVAANNYGELIFCVSSAAGGAPTNVKMTLDSSGNVGIGVTPSATDSTYYQALEIARVGQGLTCVKTAFSGTPNSWLSNNSYATYSAGTVWKYAVSSQSAAQYRLAGGEHQWFTASSGAAGTTITDFATAKMTLDASGNLLVGTTSNAPAGTQSQFVNQWSGGAKWGSTFNQTVSSATAYTHIAFCTNGTVRGSIDANNATLTYGTVSDYRLKDNVQPLSNGLSRVNALKPSSYKWKESEADGEGFIAHELASVVPLAVTGQKDAVNEDGSIKAQQVDLSKVVPILVAAIQELAAEVNALKKA